MTKEFASPTPVVESPVDDLYKSKRGRKPSQAKLAMLESKKLFAEKKRFFDDTTEKRQIKKKKIPAVDDGKNKNPKLKRKKNIKVKADSGKKNLKKDKRLDEDETKRKRRKTTRYGEHSDNDDSSDGELWDDTKRNTRNGGGSDHDRDDLFFESDDDDDFERDFYQNSDEDTEDASETDMATLEEEISEMKEQMYQEKIKELKGKLEQLNNKTLPEFITKLEELKKQKEEWIRTAYAFKAYEEKEIEREYEREKKLAKQAFEEKKNELKDALVHELSEKKKIIETEKSTVDLTGGVGAILPMESKPVITRKLRRRPNDPPPVTEKKRKTITTPLNILLHEDHILSDLKKIHKYYKPSLAASNSSKSNSDDKNNTKKTDSKCDPSEFPDGSDARIKDDQLYFNKEWYVAGDPIYLNSRDGERYNAQIHSITSTREIWIKKLTEGTRLKIYVGHLQRGKYAIERRDVTLKK